MTKTADKIITRDIDGRYTTEIIYRDTDILVINKPAGLLTIPDHWSRDKACLRDVLATHLRKGSAEQSLFVVHRLDKDTSGVMVFALNKEAHMSLNHQFENRDIQKKYLSVVCGHPFPENGIIDVPISKKMKKGGQKYIDPKNGQPAQTEYHIVKRYKEYSLIEARPLTGRMHQIRVHLKHLGNPLAVDVVYNHPGKPGIGISDLKKRYYHKPDEAVHYIINRLTLHASEIMFTHPGTSEKLTFSAPLPKDFASLVKQLERWNA